MKEIEGLSDLVKGKKTSELGTKASGFAEGGPFSCNNCVWMTHRDNEDVCTHPVVKADPELVYLHNDVGEVRVDFDDCCRYVRPPSAEQEKE